jgi:ribosome-binding factor A
MKKRSDTAPGPSQRQLRVGEIVRHAIADILSRGDLQDETFARAFVTIPEVRMSPDLKIANVLVTVHQKQDEKSVLAAFDKHKGVIRREVARRVNLKFAPDVRFRIDDRLDAVARIDALLRSPEVLRDTARRPDENDEGELGEDA